MAISAKALSLIAQDVSELFSRSSPSLRSFPKTNYDESAKSLWRGIRNNDQFDITESGDLILNPGVNFSGKTTGISFTSDPSVAWSYANRQPETPVPLPEGIVVRVRRDLFEDVDDFFEPNYRQTKPRLRNEDIEGEEAFYTDKPFVVPAGSWSVETSDVSLLKKAQNLFEEDVKKYAEMPDEEFVKRYADALANRELEEYQGGVDVFGFDYARARAESAAASDAINQIIYHRTGGDEFYALSLALRAKLEMNPSKKYQEYLNRLANEEPVTMLYGRDWFFEI